MELKMHQPRTLTFEIFHGDTKVETQVLSVDVVKIGKLKSSHLVLEDPQVARMHAVVEVTGDTIRVIDLGSATGTILNGEKVDKNKVIKNGDVLSFGPFSIKVWEGKRAESDPPEKADLIREFVASGKLGEKPSERGPDLVDWVNRAVEAAESFKSHRDQRPDHASEGHVEKRNYPADSPRMADSRGVNRFYRYHVVDRVRYWMRMAYLTVRFGGTSGRAAFKAKGPPQMPGKMKRHYLTRLKRDSSVYSSTLPWLTYVALFVVIGMFIPAAASVVGVVANEDAKGPERAEKAAKEFDPVNVDVTTELQEEPPGAVEIVADEMGISPEAIPVLKEMTKRESAPYDDTPIQREYRIRTEGGMADVEWTTDFDALEERLEKLDETDGEGKYWIEVR
jgi:hypothetical protein